MSYDIEQEMMTRTEEESAALIGYILLHVICVFGVPANVLCSLTLSRPQMKSSITCYLQFLAAYDGLFLLSWMIWMDVVRHKWLYVFMCATILGSAYTTVAVSAERFIAVCYPLKARYLLSDKRSLLCNLFIVVFIICVNFPSVFIHEYLNGPSEFMLYVNNRFGIEGIRYLERNNRSLPLDLTTAEVSTWLQLTVWLFVPLVTVTFFNICVFFTVRKAQKIRKEISQAEKKEINLSMTVFTVVAVFFCCWTPWFILKVISYNGILPYPMFFKIHVCAYVVITLNSAANVIIYSFVRREFRSTFLGMFCCKTNSKENIVM